MRTILLAGAILALSACGGGETETSDANAVTADNMMMDQNMMLDPNMTLDQNGAMGDMGNMGGAGAAGAGGTVDANTQNMMMKDATTNDPDTNLANGM